VPDILCADGAGGSSDSIGASGGGRLFKDKDVFSPFEGAGGAAVEADCSAAADVDECATDDGLSAVCVPSPTSPTPPRFLGTAAGDATAVGSLDADSPITGAVAADATTDGGGPSANSWSSLFLTCTGAAAAATAGAAGVAVAATEPLGGLGATAGGVRLAVFVRAVINTYVSGRTNLSNLSQEMRVQALTRQEEEEEPALAPRRLQLPLSRLYSSQNGRRRQTRRQCHR